MNDHRVEEDGGVDDLEKEPLACAGRAIDAARVSVGEVEKSVDQIDLGEDGVTVPQFGAIMSLVSSAQALDTATKDILTKMSERMEKVMKPIIIGLMAPVGGAAVNPDHIVIDILEDGNFGVRIGAGGEGDARRVGQIIWENMGKWGLEVVETKPTGAGWRGTLSLKKPAGDAAVPGREEIGGALKGVAESEG